MVGRLIRWVAALAVLGVGQAWAQCDPSGAVAGSVGCQATITGNVAPTDYFLGWQPTAPRGLSVKIPPSRLLEGGLPAAFSTLSASGTSTLAGTTASALTMNLTGFPALAGDDPVPTLAAFRTTYSGWTRVLGSWVTMGSSNDSVQMLRGGGGSIDYLNVAGTLTSGYQGGRTAIDGSVLEPSSATTTRIKSTTGIIGAKVSATSNNNTGGVADGFGTSFFGWSTTYGLNPTASLGSTATYRRELTGVEIDMRASAGSSFYIGSGIQIVQTSTHAVAATREWSGIKIANQIGALTAAQWKTGIQIGSNSAQWPMSTTGVLFQGAIGNNYTSVPPTASGGLDLRQVSLTDYVGRWRGGDIRPGDYGGGAQFGYLGVTSLVTGSYINTNVTKTTAVAINTAGSGYSTNDLVKTSQDVIIRVDSRITKTITGVTKASPPVVTSASHGLSNGTVFDVTVDDTDGDPLSCAVLSGMVELACQTITGITNANPGVFTVANHGIPNGTRVRISAVGGMTQMNGNPYYIVANATTNTFTLTFPNGTAVDTTNFDTWTSGGTVRVSYKVANAATNTFELNTEQGGVMNSSGWSSYVSGGTINTYIPDAVSIYVPGWEVTGDTTNVATTALTRNGRSYGTGLTVDLTWAGNTRLYVQSGGNPTYAGGVLAGSSTTAGVALQTRSAVQAKTAVVNTITVADGGTFASAPTLVVAAPPTSGSAATASVATLGALTATSFTGGTLYAVGNILTLSGGTSTQTAQFRVAEVDDPTTGVPTRLTLQRAGSYSVLPASPVSVTGGTGTGLTITPGWTLLTATVTGAGSNYPEYPPPLVTTSGGGMISDAAFVVAMTASDAVLALQPSGLATSFGGHVISGGSAPAVSSCGASPSAVTGNDTAGTLTTGTGSPTACTLTFASAFSATPVCGAWGSVGGAPVAVAATATSTSAVTFTFASAMTSGTLKHLCIQ